MIKKKVVKPQSKPQIYDEPAYTRLKKFLNANKIRLKVDLLDETNVECSDGILLPNYKILKVTATYIND